MEGGREETWGVSERDFLARDMNYLADGGGRGGTDSINFTSPPPPPLFKRKVSKFVDAGEEESATPVSYVPPLTPLRTYFKMLCIAKANSGNAMHLLLLYYSYHFSPPSPSTVYQYSYPLGRKIGI